MIIYEKWEPLQNLPERLYCDALHDDYDGFRIHLRGDDEQGPVLQIKFDSVLFYRNIDEGDYLLTLDAMPLKGSFTLFTVKNSSLFSWHNEQTYGLSAHKMIMHYAIYTPNDCIDVLSAYEPEVKWLE